MDIVGDMTIPPIYTIKRIENETIFEIEPLLNERWFIKYNPEKTLRANPYILMSNHSKYALV